MSGSMRATTLQVTSFFLILFFYFLHLLSFLLTWNYFLMTEMRPSIYTYFGILSLISMDIGRWIYSGDNRDLNPGPNVPKSSSLTTTLQKHPSYCLISTSITSATVCNVTLYWFLFFSYHFLSLRPLIFSIGFFFNFTHLWTNEQGHFIDFLSTHFYR